MKASLAAYKAPRHVVVVDTIGRAPNGKVDYKRLKELAIAEPLRMSAGHSRADNRRPRRDCDRYTSPSMTRA